MKCVTYLLILLTTICVFSCQQANDKKQTAVTKLTAIDSLRESTDQYEKNRLAKRKIIDEANKRDSIRQQEILAEALAFACKKGGQEKFHKAYDRESADSSSVKIDVSIDNYFNKSVRHLIIRRHALASVYIDIYARHGLNFEKVITHELAALEYVNDTIRDINGDGLKDFTVNWYGMSGCCLKGFTNVYLQRPDKTSFSGNFEFINPTFSPAQKIIRGVCYGHPGETEMYKYKWNGEKVDTIEYIAYEFKKSCGKTGKIIVSDHEPYNKNYHVIKQLNDVPAEYKKIDGYDWFSND